MGVPQKFLADLLADGIARILPSGLFSVPANACEHSQIKDFARPSWTKPFFDLLLQGGITPHRD